MKLFLTNREQLQSLGSFLVSEFDSLIAKIRGAWNVEHDEEGRHGNVHAVSVSSGRLTFSDIAQDTLASEQVDNYTPAGIDTAAILRLNSTLTTLVTITGLKVPLDASDAVLDGRALVLENVSQTTTFKLPSESSYSSPRNRFRTSHQQDPLDEAAPAWLYLPPMSLLLLTYNATQARWIIHSRSIDDNVRYVEQATGTYNDLEIANWLSVRTLRLAFTSASATISGFDTTGIPETHRKTVVNAGLYAFDILHQNTGSLADNRVACPSAIRYRVNPGETFDLQRTSAGWQIVEKADQWSDVAFNAANFTASAGTWTLTSPDQVTWSYQLDGNKMTVSFEFDDTSVSAGPAELRVAIPLGRIAARKMSAPLSSAIDNATALDTGRAQVTAGVNYISFYKNAASAAWTASANATSIRGQFTFMVRDDIAAISETHTDTAHGDTAHSDADHGDVAHVDAAASSTHGDSAHSDAAHSDTAHEDTAHADSEGSPHVDHTDVGHADVPASGHVDTAHVDTGHGDSAHADVPAVSEHSDSPHGDTAHVDGTHGDTAHSDTAHGDVGAHSDTSHADI